MRRERPPQLVVRGRMRPWLVVRGGLGLPEEPALILIGADYLRTTRRVLAPAQEVLLLEVPGPATWKGALPLSWLPRLARRAPRRLLDCDNRALYRYLRLDRATVLAVADEQMVSVADSAMTLKRALELAAERLAPEKPQPQGA